MSQFGHAQLNMARDWASQFDSIMSTERAVSPQGLLAQAIDLALLPVRVAVSPLARRAYLSAFLLTVASGGLLFLSAIAYVLFYWAYVPHAAVSVPIYLQYGHEPPGSGLESILAAAHHPFGTALLTPQLSAYQRYDVEVVLDLPTSPVNRRAGNFMIEVALMAPSTSGFAGGGGSGSGSILEGGQGSGMEQEAEEQRRQRERDRLAKAAVQHSGGRFGDLAADDPTLAQEKEAVVVRARRPALLRYTSRPVDFLRLTAGLPWYALGWADEREQLAIAMLEDVEFVPAPRTRKIRGGAPGVPDRVRVTIEAREPLELYGARVEIRAKLSGLRWLMYRYKVLSFLLFTGGFFGATMGSAVAVYAALTIRQVLREDAELQAARLHGVKQEELHDDETGTVTYTEDEMALSDTSRQFPTGHGKEPLKFSGRSRLTSRDDDSGGSGVVIKREEGEEGGVDIGLEDSARLGHADADAEDNSDDYQYDDVGSESFRDSGIGTGREDRAAAATRRRRKISAAGDDTVEGWDGRGRTPGI